VASLYAPPKKGISTRITEYKKNSSGMFELVFFYVEWKEIY